MNGKDIFLGLKFVDAELIEEAEFGKLPMKELQTETTKRRRAFRRPFLLAALIALMLGHSLAACGGFIATDTLSTLFAALVTWIARKLDGMLEEQKHYLLRVAEEQKREQDARGNDPWQ